MKIFNILKKLIFRRLNQNKEIIKFKELVQDSATLALIGSIFIFIVTSFYECYLSRDVIVPPPLQFITSLRSLIIENNFKIIGDLSANSGLRKTSRLYQIWLQNFNAENLTEVDLIKSIYSYKQEQNCFTYDCSRPLYKYRAMEIRLEALDFRKTQIKKYGDDLLVKINLPKGKIWNNNFYLKKGRNKLSKYFEILLESGIVGMLEKFQYISGKFSKEKATDDFLKNLKMPRAFKISDWRIAPSFAVWFIFLLSSFIFLIFIEMAPMKIKQAMNFYKNNRRTLKKKWLVLKSYIKCPKLIMKKN